MSDVTPDDRDLAIRTMLGEEGSEEGWAGVAAVILNRLAAGSYGGSVGDVVLAPHQFEAWTRQSDRLLGIKRNDPRYVEAGQLFDAVRDGSLPDPTNGATHFYAPAAQAALGRQAPGWSQGQGLKLGSSMFYAPQGRVARKPDAPQTYMDFGAALGRIGAQPPEMKKPSIAPQPVAPQVPNRPPAFLKDAQPVAPPQIAASQVPNRPPAFLKDAQSVPKPDGAPPQPSSVASVPSEFSDPITAENYRKANEPLHDRRYPLPPPLPGAFMGPSEGPLAGSARDPSLPFGVRGLAAIGQEGLNAVNAPLEMMQQQAQRIRQGGPLTPQDAGSVAMNAGMLGMREAPGGILATRGTAPGVASPIEPPVPLRPAAVAEKPAVVATPSAPSRPPVEPPSVAKPVVAPTAKPAALVEPPSIAADSSAHKDALAKLNETKRRLEELIPKPVEPPPVAKPTVAPIPEKVGPRITQPKAQALVDELRKRFGVEKPVPVTVSNAGSPNTFGSLRTNWAGAKNDLLQKFRMTGTVDPAMGTPDSYAITVRSDSSDRALSVATLLHEFGHVLQNDKFVSAPAETRTAILVAFHRETKAFGKLSPEAFSSAALDPVKNATTQDLEARLGGNIVASSYQEYNQRFNEWFANQVATWFTTTREATSVVDKFFKGIADAWKAIYQRVTGRRGAAPEIDAFMRGMWDEGKTVEETPQPTTRDIQLKEIQDERNEDIRGYGEQEFAIHRRGEKEPSGYIRLKNEGKNIYVQWTGRSRNEAKERLDISANANTLGPSTVREILREVQNLFPDAETISGLRISGTHLGGAVDTPTVVRLRQPAVGEGVLGRRHSRGPLEGPDRRLPF